MDWARETARRYLNLLKALNDALEKEEWGKSPYLRVMRDKLVKHRDTLYSELQKAGVLPPDGDPDDSNDATDNAKPVVKTHQSLAPAGMIPVYISLYCSEGKREGAWEPILASIPTTSISRPIYRQEAHVREWIQAKPNRHNEGYCGIFIREADIAKPYSGQNPKDKSGHELLVLKKGAIQPKNLFLFMHESGEYTCKEGRLHKIKERADD